ncbi:MAG: hypothetical protein COX81_00715 [Candidatus Magasanikbacteria bacterium CG_4_10_14_0_2_um_filter_37_12]|uniref:Uncharacterized protein n=1 Tax=Candidatus Magasanikbacteria bacterium CG_4_10_14_0_2_um_filter_37_12 TaxID=1974637 RepID=A0A2M7V9Q1_9BACT|nr:MAG: hypothetical protein COX81_00715 [Candidatus Magasanikbacteria bacterium CG_4_10_14_0_2_um_filter_37_12]
MCVKKIAKITRLLFELEKRKYLCYTTITMEIIIKIIGAIGLVLITWGIFIKKETRQDYIFVLGGLFLLTYSIHLKDPIFIPLQIVFVLASLYEIHKIKKIKK